MQLLMRAWTQQKWYDFAKEAKFALNTGNCIQWSKHVKEILKLVWYWQRYRHLKEISRKLRMQKVPKMMDLSHKKFHFSVTNGLFLKFPSVEQLTPTGLSAAAMTNPQHSYPWLCISFDFFFYTFSVLWGASGDIYRIYIYLFCI